MTKFTEEWARNAKAGPTLDKVCWSALALDLDLEIVNEVPSPLSLLPLNSDGDDGGGKIQNKNKHLMNQAYRFIRVEHPTKRITKFYSQDNDVNAKAWDQFLSKNPEWLKTEIVLYPPYSTEWAAAGQLLEIMDATIRADEKPRCSLVPDGPNPLLVYGDTPCHAIARAFAVLKARENL